MDIENTSWKVRGYGFYSRFVKYHKTNEWTQRTSEFYDTKRRVNKSCTKHFPWCFLFIIYISRFHFNFHKKCFNHKIELKAKVVYKIVPEITVFVQLQKMTRDKSNVFYKAWRSLNQLVKFVWLVRVPQVSRSVDGNPDRGKRCFLVKLYCFVA